MNKGEFIAQMSDGVNMATAYPVSDERDFIFYFDPGYAYHDIDDRLDAMLKLAGMRYPYLPADFYLVGGSGADLLWKRLFQLLQIRYGSVPNISSIVVDSLNENEYIVPYGKVRFLLNVAQDQPAASLLRKPVLFKDVKYPGGSFDFYIFVEDKETGQMRQIMAKMIAFRSMTLKPSSHDSYGETREIQQ